MHEQLKQIAKLIRCWILSSTTKAGSGHPTSSLSAVELMVGIFFGGYFRFDIAHPEDPGNDRLIFSKGHAAPLFYALWAAAGAVSPEELMSLRKFSSRLEGHPAVSFPYTEAATGSLGQGLSVGVGMALNARLDQTDKANRSYKTYVLLGDSEMSEGSVWEAIQLAAHYKLDNLVGVLDVNRLGQRGETMYGHDVEAYAKRVGAFGWETIIVRDGHSLDEILGAYERALAVHSKPAMIIAKTIKGKGVSFIEDKEGWHGKPLSADELKQALAELGEADQTVRGAILPPARHPERSEGSPTNVGNPAKAGRDSSAPAALQNDMHLSVTYPPDQPVATRKAYGNALARIFPNFPNIVVLDAEVKNSTYAEIFEKTYPERFFEMYIAEQNMVGVALGLARRGKIPFVSTFAAFLTRAFDQIRMSQYSNANIKFCGSHAGVSIGEDGASQMGLEDIAMFRAVMNSVVFYPADAVATEKLVEEVARHRGMVYIRTSRPATPILYGSDEAFPIGGSKVLRQSPRDAVTVVAAGVTVFEALAAHEALLKEGTAIRVIDLYSVKPLDVATLKQAARETRAIITVEDHVAEGGIGEAVTSALSCAPPLTPPRQGGEIDKQFPPLPEGRLGGVRISSLAVRKIPTSGTSAELLDFEGISRHAIVKAVKELL